tara:strand:- start:203 stop:517 length:315 start_codon:yes stop_codon:yes gene_type:complete
MPNDFEAFWVALGDNTEFDVIIDKMRSINLDAINLARQSRLSQTWAYISGNTVHGDCLIEGSLRSIGKSDYRHFTLLNSVATHTKGRLQARRIALWGEKLKSYS